MTRQISAATLGSYRILCGLSLATASKPVGRAAPEVLRMYDQTVGPILLLVILFTLLLSAAAPSQV